MCQRRFAGARATDQRDRLARLDLEADVAKGRPLLLPVPERHRLIGDMATAVGRREIRARPIGDSWNRVLDLEIAPGGGVRLGQFLDDRRKVGNRRE
ncbi:MAG: hypothetical protein R2849_20515 [Thermomicrobiales bacterium]